MRRAIGAVLVMIGATWFALGAGFIQGSVMSGQVIWAVIGVALAAGGGYVLSRRPKA
jgi:LPXTG-motif cell wall-anchored protein